MSHSLSEKQDAPLILTLELEKSVQDWAQSMRDRHFPQDRNIVPAHITLFHALPADYADTLLTHLTGYQQAPCVTIEAPFLLGRGVAYRILSPEIKVVREEIAALVPPERRTAQDRARWHPHLTIQNKVSPQKARELLENLLPAYRPVRTYGAALRLWRYLGGPWELLVRTPFTPRSHS
ncbi:2'-5' RNA ligase family protein [Gluconobacter sp. LMG 1744]|uniref:2'-5' RNA ligase family protein n=1 Tax=Gluconobacter cadivus TaxID=2728101 RepID=UPI001884AA61|nr:2'-5' RNA ligase family protein [Gluconobacter cadivus]MBF0891881.1 2'-5' RNA ligase family protein [Gluconobacter cadivus]